MTSGYGFIDNVGPSGNQRNVTVRKLGKGYVKDNEVAFEIQRSVSKDGETETITVVAAKCAGCNKHFTEENQPAGSCHYCDFLICEVCCGTKHCWYDERLVCAGCGGPAPHGWSCGHSFDW